MSSLSSLSNPFPSASGSVMAPTPFYESYKTDLFANPYSFIKYSYPAAPEKFAPFLDLNTLAQFLSSALTHHDYPLIKTILDHRAPEIKSTVSLLSLLDKHKVEPNEAALFQEIRENLYREVFVGRSDEEVIAIAESNPMQSFQWALLSERTDLSDQIIQKCLQGGGISTAFQLIHELELRIEADQRKKEEALLQLAHSPFSSALIDRCLDWEEQTVINKKKIETIFFHLAKKSFSFELIEQVVARRGKTILPAERLLINQIKRQLPDLNHSLISFELLQRATNGMDLASFQPTPIQIKGKPYLVHDVTNAPFCFLVHAADPEEGAPEKIVRQQMEKGYLCTSLISQDLPHFFKESERYALVVSVSPDQIAAVSREDGGTPCGSAAEAHPFYQFYQRLQLLTSYVDRLYRESGLQEIHPTDDYQRLNRLLSIERVKPGTVDPVLLQQIKIKVFGRNLDETELYADYKRGVSLQKAQILFTHYKRLADQASMGKAVITPEERFRFEEIGKAKAALESIAYDSPMFYNESIHPFCSAKELLNQTPFQNPTPYNHEGLYPYNEVNIDLTKREKNPIEVKAILLHWDGSDESLEKYEKIVEDAAGNIPILIKRAPILPSGEAHGKLRLAAQNNDVKTVETLLKNQIHLTERQIGEVLVAAAYAHHEETMLKILEERPNLPKEWIVKAFEKSFSLLNSFSLGDCLLALLEKKPELLINRALDLLPKTPPQIYLRIVDFMLQRGISIDATIAGQSLIHAAKLGKTSLAQQLLAQDFGISLADQQTAAIRSIEWHQPATTLQFFKPEIADFVFRSCLEKDRISHLAHLLSADKNRNSISNDTIREAIQTAVRNRSYAHLYPALIAFHPEHRIENEKLAYETALSLQDKTDLANKILTARELRPID